MDTIQLLERYNKLKNNKRKPVFMLILFMCCILTVGFIGATVFSQGFIFLSSVVAVLILPEYFSPHKKQEFLLGEIKHSIYCGNLNKIFDLNNPRVEQVVQIFYEKINNDIFKHHGIKGNTILDMLGEVESWKQYDLESAKRKDFKEAFENSPTTIGQMFQQIKTLNQGDNH